METYSELLFAAAPPSAPSAVPTTAKAQPAKPSTSQDSAPRQSEDSPPRHPEKQSLLTGAGAPAPLGLHAIHTRSAVPLSPLCVGGDFDSPQAQEDAVLRHMSAASPMSAAFNALSQLRW